MSILILLPLMRGIGFGVGGHIVISINLSSHNSISFIRETDILGILESAQFIPANSNSFSLL
jgi:hypothetical protein